MPTARKKTRRWRMKALVVYDSVFGNTERIAKAVADGLASKWEVRPVRAGAVNADEIKGLDLLIVGAPTQGGRPTPAVQAFLKGIPPDGLKNVKTAAFDTRISRGGVGTFAKLFGYASGRIESELKHAGGTHISSQGFAVRGRQGPLEEGEVEKAGEWARGLAG
jgi:flavodoxin